MNISFRKGMSFGLSSSIITTLGLMIGLESGTHQQLIVLGGILTIAIADSLSDALAMHVSEESSGKKKKEVWESTLSTLLSKFFFAITFIIPVLLLELRTAIIVSTVWGIIALSGLSYYIAKLEHEKPWKVVTEHVFIAILVIIITFFIGTWINTAF